MKKLLLAASALMLPVATPALASGGPAKDITLPVYSPANPGQYGGHEYHGSFKRLPPVQLDGGETYVEGVVKSKAIKGEIPMDAVNRTWHEEDPVRETSYNQYNQSWEQAPATVWSDAPATEIQMAPQNLVMPGLVVPTIPLVKVKSVHNDKEIAFLLTWYDSSKSETETMEDKFSDAIAIMFPVNASSEPSFMMGDDENPVNIVYWKAAWERDLEFGYQDVRDAYPNYNYDMYPEVIPAIGQTIDTPIRRYNEGQRQYLTALKLRNISRVDPERLTAVEELNAVGFGTLTRQAQNNSVGHGVRRFGYWSVVIKRPLNTGDVQDAVLKAGSTTKMAIAAWDGRNKNDGAGGNRGPRKNYSNGGWVPLEIE